MYSALEVTLSALLVIDHAAKIIETLITYSQYLVATMLWVKYKIHGSNPNSIEEMISGGT